MPADRLFDIAIIGAGLAGVIHLHYARQAGLDAVVLEARPGVGGLWRELPEGRGGAKLPIGVARLR